LVRPNRQIVRGFGKSDGQTAKEPVEPQSATERWIFHQNGNPFKGLRPVIFCPQRLHIMGLRCFRRSDCCISLPRRHPLASAAVPAQPESSAGMDADGEAGGRVPSQAAYPAPLAQCALCRQTPEVGAECPNWARSDLCGGRSAMRVPTANNIWLKTQKLACVQAQMRSDAHRRFFGTNVEFIGIRWARASRIRERLVSAI
jgi:hypothetical protein